MKLRVTEQLHSLGLGFWRVPLPWDFSGDGGIVYRTMAGCYWGCRTSVEIVKLLRAFRWLQRRGRLPICGLHPRQRVAMPLFGANWPDYGSDEYFKNIVLFPRLAHPGCMTILQRPPRSLFLLYDVEYVTWANRESFIDYSLYPYVSREPERDETGGEVELPSNVLPDAPISPIASTPDFRSEPTVAQMQ